MHSHLAAVTQKSNPSILSHL